MTSFISRLKPPKEKAMEIREVMFDGCQITLQGAYPIFRAMSVKLSLVATHYAIEGVQQIIGCEKEMHTPEQAEILEYWTSVVGHLRELL